MNNPDSPGSCASSGSITWKTSGPIFQRYADNSKGDAKAFAESIFSSQEPTQFADAIPVIALHSSDYPVTSIRMCIMFI